MRYQNWDVLLFPERSKVPLQEFKTTCHVVQEPACDFIPIQNTNPILPTLCAFVPALRPGQRFRLSIHSWETPQPSRLAQTLTKNSESIKFEARLFMDGRLSGYKTFARDGSWPVIIETGLTVDKNGDAELLTFPPFHHDLLTQSYWNAGDDHGRIKVIISEGFPRDSTAMPFERVKNLIAFSFQHAPLEVLESSGIAWPNAAMWRQVSFTAAVRPNVVDRKPSDSASNYHSHSPRRRALSSARTQLPPPAMGLMLPPGIPSYARQTVAYDPFIEPRLAHYRPSSSSNGDVSMPDYPSTSASSAPALSRQFTDPTQQYPDRSDRRYQTLQTVGAYETLCEALLPGPKSIGDENSIAGLATKLEAGVTDGSPNLLRNAEKGTLHQMPASYYPTAAAPGGIAGRRDRAQESPNAPQPTPASNMGESVQRLGDTPSVLGSATNTHKRQRVITPASSKVIDKEDEPRSLCKLQTEASQVAQGQGHEARRALGDLANIH